MVRRNLCARALERHRGVFNFCTFYLGFGAFLACSLVVMTFIFSDRGGAGGGELEKRAVKKKNKKNKQSFRCDGTVGIQICCA